MTTKTTAAGGSQKRIAIVVFACLIGLMAGLIYAWSIWVQPLCAERGWNTDQVALMGNVMLATFVFGVTLGGQLLPKLGAKTSCLIGSIAFGGFVIISAFVSSPVVMYITYGAVAGIGVGILYVVCQFSAAAWFPDRRGFVMGIFLAIFGLSVTIFASPLNMLIAAMGARTTMLITGITITVVCLIGSLFMSTPPAGWSPAAKSSSTGAAAKPVTEVTSLTVRQAIRTKHFWLITIAYLVMVWPYAFISSYVAVFITEGKMLPAAVAVTAISFTGIGSAAGRFIGGAIVDKVGCKITFLIMSLCSIISCLAMIPARSAGLICFLFLIMCVGYGGRTPVYGVIYTKQFGPKYSSGIYGYGTLGTAIFLMVAPITTAALRAANGGSFTPALIVAAVVAVIGCTSMMLLPKKAPIEN